jgi:hypothetical protein
MTTKSIPLTQYKAVTALSSILFPAPKSDTNKVFMANAKTLLILALNIETDLMGGDASKVTLRGIRKWFNLDNLISTLSDAAKNNRITPETESLRESFLRSIPGVSIYADGVISVTNQSDADIYFGYSAMYFSRAFDIMTGITSAANGEEDLRETQSYLMSVLAA